MLCTTPVDQSRSRQASFSYTAHHLAVYEKRQVTQNLFISTQCQGGSGKRKYSFTMSRLNFRDLIEQLLSSIFRPVTKRERLLNTVSLFFTIKYLGGGMAFMVVLRNFSECNGLKFYMVIFNLYPKDRQYQLFVRLYQLILLQKSLAGSFVYRPAV